MIDLREESSLALKEAAGPGNGDRLIHHPLADAEILVDPLGDFLVFAGYLIALEADFVLLIRRVQKREESSKEQLTSSQLTASRRREKPRLGYHMQKLAHTKKKEQTNVAGGGFLRRTASKA